MLLALRHFEKEWIRVNVDFERVCVCGDDVKRCRRKQIQAGPKKGP